MAALRHSSLHPRIQVLWSRCHTGEHPAALNTQPFKRLSDLGQIRPGKAPTTNDIFLIDGHGFQGFLEGRNLFIDFCRRENGDEKTPYMVVCHMMGSVYGGGRFWV